jgi:hypothetical protein
MYPAADLLIRHPGGGRGPSFRGMSGHPPNEELKLQEKLGAAQEWAPAFAGVTEGNFPIFIPT